MDRGLRQADLAARVGISASYLNLIEHGRRRIGGALLARLAQELEADPAALSRGAERGTVDRIRAAATEATVSVDLDRAEDLAARYPDWAALIAQQAQRIGTLQDQLRTLSDRMGHDPELAASLHEVVSSVTSIRSTASILTGEEPLDRDWLDRFHGNINVEARRLVQSVEQMTALLGVTNGGDPMVQSPRETVDAALRARDFHLAELEQGQALDLDLPTPQANALFAAFCDTYRQDAAALPLDRFLPQAIAADFDPGRLSQLAAPDRLMRRLASLPSGPEVPPLGLVICDGAGAILHHKPVPGFDLPDFGAACSLWPHYTALSQPGRPVACDVLRPTLPDVRFRATAIAVEIAPASLSHPPVLRATMLVRRDPVPSGIAPLAVGPGCRICPSPDCAARREPSGL